MTRFVVPRTLLIAFLTFFILSSQANAEQTLYFTQVISSVNQKVGALILRDIYQRIGFKISLTPMSAKRALVESNAGRKDGELLRIAGVSKKYPNLMRVPTPLFSLKSQIFAAHDSLLTIETLTDIAPLNIVLTSGVLHAEQLAQKAGAKNIHTLATEVKMLKFLARGRADIAIASQLNGIVTVNEQKLSEIAPLGEPLNAQPMYHFLHVKHQAIIEPLDRIIQQMQRSGELKNLQKKYIAQILAQSAQRRTLYVE